MMSWKSSIAFKKEMFQQICVADILLVAGVDKLANQLISLNQAPCTHNFLSVGEL